MLFSLARHLQDMQDSFLWSKIIVSGLIFCHADKNVSVAQNLARWSYYFLCGIASSQSYLGDTTGPSCLKNPKGRDVVRFSTSLDLQDIQDSRFGGAFQGCDFQDSGLLDGSRCYLSGIPESRRFVFRLPSLILIIHRMFNRKYLATLQDILFCRRTDLSM